jgi:hypothetical protein
VRSACCLRLRSAYPIYIRGSRVCSNRGRSIGWSRKPNSTRLSSYRRPKKAHEKRHAVLDCSSCAPFDAITRCGYQQLDGTPSVPCPLGMDLTAWFRPQRVFSSGEAAHIFSSGSVPGRALRCSIEVLWENDDTLEMRCRVSCRHEPPTHGQRAHTTACHVQGTRAQATGSGHVPPGVSFRASGMGFMTWAS